MITALAELLAKVTEGKKRVVATLNENKRANGTLKDNAVQEELTSIAMLG